MLTLPIKKRWFDMILFGEKKEEYREITDYYTTRFANLHFERIGRTFKGKTRNEKLDEFFRGVVIASRLKKRIPLGDVCFRNGYGRNAPRLVCNCELSISQGKPEWGAEEGREYYILHIKNSSTLKEGIR